MRPRLDPYSGRPLYRQLADVIRDAIEAGELQPGQQLPAEGRLAGDYELGLDAVRDALAVLRGEGLIETLRGKGSRVRARPEPEVVSLPPGARVRTRMPTDTERQELEIPEGTPVFVVERDGRTEILAGDRTVLETSDGSEDTGD